MTTDGVGARATSNHLRLLGQGGVLVAAFVVAGILFLGTPAGTPSLPDPATMSLVGRAHNTSAENVDFWSARVAQDPTSSPALVQLACNSSWATTSRRERTATGRRGRPAASPLC